MNDKKDINNPNKVQVGETVQLDKEFRNTSKVVILEMTPLQLYSKVKSPESKDGDAWDVMTSRLSKI